MAKAFDQLENAALRFGAGVQPNTKWRNLSTEQRQGFDDYVKRKVRNNPSVYADDTRAKKYLKDYDQNTFDTMRQQEIRDGVNPGGIWDDFGGSGQPTTRWNEAEPESADSGEQQREQSDWRDQPDENEPEKEETEDTEASEEPKIGEDTTPKPKPEPEPGAGAPESGVVDATKAAEGLGEAGEAASAGAAAAGANVAAAGAAAAGAEAAAAGTAAAGAATAGAVAVESNPVGWVLTIIAILAVVVIFLVVVGAIFFNNPDSASGLAPTSNPGTGNAAALMEKACFFKDNPDEYKKVMANSWTDCWGFVATSLRYGADSDFRYAPRAMDAPVLLKNHDQTKHNNTKYMVLPFSTRSLKPGDMMFVTKNGKSHAGLYIRNNYCNCGTQPTLQASLGTHGPKCDSIANSWDTIVRIVE